MLQARVDGHTVTEVPPLACRISRPLIGRHPSSSKPIPAAKRRNGTNMSEVWWVPGYFALFAVLRKSLRKSLCGRGFMAF
jgi:hypothetical protein